MKNKIRKSIIAAMLFIGLFSIPVSASPMKGPLFMGTVTKAEKCNDSKNIKLTVEGYMKACDVYKGQIIVIVNDSTKVTSSCDKKDSKEDIKCEVGDYVCIALDKKITKSIPPQAAAKRIQVTKAKERAEKETSVNDVYNEEEKAESEEDKESKDEKTFGEDIKSNPKEDSKEEIKKEVKEESKEEK
ncbi:MAG: hypothetical protein ACRCVJ_09855 [Clostridium sp.]|uniref:hypothetical protein n=1 Tax=Clostridium sp. TaxID=1506 RepID=UPI003F3BB81A